MRTSTHYALSNTKRTHIDTHVLQDECHHRDDRDYLPDYPKETTEGVSSGCRYAAAHYPFLPNLNGTSRRAAGGGTEDQGTVLHIEHLQIGSQLLLLLPYFASTDRYCLNQAPFRMAQNVQRRTSLPVEDIHRPVIASPHYGPRPLSEVDLARQITRRCARRKASDGGALFEFEDVEAVLDVVDQHHFMLGIQRRVSSAMRRYYC